MEKMQKQERKETTELVKLVKELRSLEEKSHRLKLQIFALICEGDILFDDEVVTENEGIALRNLVAFHLRRLGIPITFSAYGYLKEGIALKIEQPEKNFYELVEEKCSSKTENTRRTIRYAIQEIYNSNNKDVWKKYFGNKRPVASQLIKRLVEGVETEWR